MSIAACIIYSVPLLLFFTTQSGFETQAYAKRFQVGGFLPY